MSFGPSPPHLHQGDCHAMEQTWVHRFPLRFWNHDVHLQPL